MKAWLHYALTGCAIIALGACVARAEEGGPPHERDDLAGFMDWLLADNERALSNLRFADVVRKATGKRVFALDPDDSVDAEVLDMLAAVFDAVIASIRQPQHPIHAIGRINEVSGAIEDILQEAIDDLEALSCIYPPNALGRIQRAGYPDLRIEHLASGRVYYLDPKVYREGSERSGFRTFYYEPRTDTNKILDNAAHLILGIAHRGRTDDLWDFAHWTLVDLIDFEVRLKAEFQASNRELYAPAGVRRQGGFPAHPATED